ncbi:MAG: hypothetical protein Q8936_00365 [Bacillota bacterium]|nr:hypothetical protein [Bacillota bacterium]
MDINGAMSTYNMSSLWNAMNNTSSTSTVPLVTNISSAVQENNLKNNYFGETTSTELQDIYQQVEPTYGIPLTYDNSGSLTMPSITTLPSNSMAQADSNILSLIQSGESSSDLTESNILYQFNAIESGIYQAAASKITSSDPSTVYNSVNSLLDNQTESTGNNLDVTV